MKNLKKRILSLFLILAMVLTSFPINNGIDTVEAAGEETIGFEYRYGTSTLIQVNTDLPASTPIVNFTADQNGCSIDQSGNTVQWVGWIGMTNADGTIVLTFNFNNAFTAGQTYVLPKGAIFGFTDNTTYALDGDYTFTFDGSGWTMTVENQVVIPDELSFAYRYGTNNLIQVNTNLPSTTPLVNFTAGDNGCNIDQSANQYQQVGWIQMDNADGTIVLTFHFNNAFTAGQTYVLPQGAIFGFTDDNTYPLDKNYKFTFDGSAWSMSAEEEPEEVIPEELIFAFNSGTANSIKLSTNLPASTPIVNFLATDNGCNIIQAGDQSFGWAGMSTENDKIVITFNFNNNFSAGQAWSLGEGSIFGFTDGRTYPLDKHYTFVFDGLTWTMSAMETPTKLNMQYRYGTSKLIQVNTNIPATTPCKDFLADSNGCVLLQDGNQSLGWATMTNASGTIVLTFNFNSEFASGQTYTLGEGSVFGFTDGKTYQLDMNYTFTFNGSAWMLETMPTLEVVSDVELMPGYTTERLVQFGNVYDFGLSEQGDLEFVGTVMLDGVVVDTVDFEGYSSNTTICLNINHAGKVLTIMKGSLIYYGATAVEVSKTFNMKWTGSGDQGIWEEIDTINSSVEGDANGDTEINALDIVRVLKVLAGEKTANNQCDLDENQKQTGVDVHYLRLILLEGSLVELDYLDERFYSHGGDFVTFADIPVDSRDVNKIKEYQKLGFNTSLLTEDYTGDVMEQKLKVVCETTEPVKVENPLVLTATGYTNGTLIQCTTNLPYIDYPDFLPTGQGYEIYPENSRNIQYVQMFETNDIVYMNPVLKDEVTAGHEYVLEQGSQFTFNGVVYTLDRTYTFKLTNDYLISLENLDNAGLNVWIRNYTNLPDYFTEQKTNVLLKYKDIIDGFYMADEPFETAALLSASGQTGTSDFASLSNTLVPWFKENFPETYFHINHVPISSYDHYTGNAENASYYKTFLDKYTNTFLKPLGTNAGKTICFDNYPFVQKQKDGFFGWGAQSGILENYLQNIMVAAVSSKEYNENSINGDAHFGMCVQTFNATSTTGDSSRDITKASEVTLQLYTGMAHGVDLFEYFTYNSGSNFQGIMDSSGNKRLYDLVKTANEDAFAFADMINTFDWQGTMTVHGDEENDSQKAFDKVSDLVITYDNSGVLAGASSTHDTVIGYHTIGQKDGYMVVSYNDPVAFANTTNEISLTFAECTKARIYTAQDGKLTSKVVDLVNGTYTCDVAPGDAFFIIPA